MFWQYACNFKQLWRKESKLNSRKWYHSWRSHTEKEKTTKNNNCHKVKYIPETSVVWIYDSTVGNSFCSALHKQTATLCEIYTTGVLMWLWIYCRFAPSPQSRHHISSLYIVSNSLYQNTNKTEEETSAIAPPSPNSDSLWSFYSCCCFFFSTYTYSMYLYVVTQMLSVLMPFSVMKRSCSSNSKSTKWW